MSWSKNARNEGPENRERKTEEAVGRRVKTKRKEPVEQTKATRDRVRVTTRTGKIVTVEPTVWVKE